MDETRRERKARIKLARANMTVRRVWVLPSHQVDAILDYQEEHRLPSEVAAARELLDQALTAKGF